MLSSALARIPVGVLVERRAARSEWLDVLWRPVRVLPGVPSADAWTQVATCTDAAIFYAGPAVIELHRADTEPYRDNLLSGAPLLWVVLRRAATAPGIALLSVTGDPATGEALTGAGDDLIETVPMPQAIRDRFTAFVAEYYVDRPTYRRERDRTGSREHVQ
jgi:hypothetical protein